MKHLRQPLAIIALFLIFGFVTASPGQDRWAPTIKLGGSPNVTRLGRLSFAGYFSVGGIEIEQEMSRPFVYLTQYREKPGFVVLDVEDPSEPKVIYQWHISDQDPDVMGFGETGKYFKTGGRYYYARVSGMSGKPSDLCAVVFDVTGLPDPAAVEEVGRIRSSEIHNGCVSVHAYKHSDGRVLLFGTPRGVAPGTEPHARIYDMDRFLAGEGNLGLVGKIPLPEQGLKSPSWAYHDVYAAFDPGTQQDKVYGAGLGGFHIFDITKPESPRHLGSLSRMSGIQNGHTIVTSPDGQIAVTQMEYQHSPMMVFDLAPVLDGRTKTISRPVGSWIADWRDVAHNMELRYPYVFVSGYEDGLQIFDVRDPRNPTTVGWYYTCECTHQTGFGGLSQLRGTSVFNGAIELDVRNADGLIVLSDVNTGFWTFRLDGFTGWNGEDYGVANVSSAQDWDNGPTGKR